MSDQLFTEEGRKRFIESKMKVYEYEGRSAKKSVYFTLEELSQFVGPRDAKNLALSLGGQRIRLTDRTYKKKTRQGNDSQSKIGLVSVDRNRLIELYIRERSIDVLFRHLKGAYVYIPKLRITPWLQINRILGKLAEGESKKKIAGHLSISQSALSYFIKKYVTPNHKGAEKIARVRQELARLNPYRDPDSCE